MKNSLKYVRTTAAIVVAAAFTGSGWATTYTDATGETISADIIDIASVEVSNDNTDLIFKITPVGDVVATDWGKYLVGMDLDGGAATGDTNGNGWGRPISMSTGMDYWFGSWVDSGNGAEVYDYSDATNGWYLQNATYDTPGGLSIAKTTNSVTISYPFSSLGLSISDSFYFDVYTTGGGGGDGAIDALGNPAQTIANWGDSYDSGVNMNMYTLTTPVAPTNSVTIAVNMEVELAEGMFVIGDDLWVRGAFNGWLDPDPTSNTNAPNWALTQDVGNTLGFGTNVWFGTFDLTGFNGKTYDYKYWSIFTTTYGGGGYEYPMLSCGANRTLTITNEGGAQTQPLDYFSDRMLSDPTTPVTFQVDMSVQAAVGNFDTNAGDTVYCRGNFTGWAATFQLTNDFGSANPLLYTGTTDFTNTPCGACFSYKYNINGVDEGYEGISNRQLDIDCTNGILPVVFFDDISGDCDFVINDTNWVTFTLDMSQAVEVTSNTVYNGSWDVYLSGEFLGWPAWDTSSLAPYQLTQIGGTSNYTITLPFAPGEDLRMIYKYGADAGDPGNVDNEAGFGQNHLRWIRTTPGQTNYTVFDVWTGTNAQNIANLEEDQLSIGINPGPAGTVGISWWGLRCAELQSATNVTGPWTTESDAVGVGSTNLPATMDQEYYRLYKP